MAQIPFECFEPAMPAALRELLTRAKANQGPLVWLLHERTRASGGNCQAMLRGNPPLPAEIVGWAAGLSMFDANPRFTAWIFRDYSVAAAIPFALEAIGVGISAGVEASVELWKCLDILLRVAPQVPDALLNAMPVGLTSSSAIARAAALGVINRAPGRALPIVEAARKQQKLSATNARRLDEVIAALAPKPAEPAAAASGGVLVTLLDAWAETFDERLIAPITAAGADETKRRGVLRAASKGELEKAWLALAAKRDPGDVDRLLGTPWPGAWKLARARVDALEKFPQDPRIAAAVKTHAARYTSWAGRAVGQAATRVASRHQRARLKDAPDALLRQASALTAHAGDLAALWAAFWERPFDEARRAVLADALQHAGDPRGEFITLQLALAEGRADAAAEKRANALLEAHLDSWAGSLPGVELASREFTRGFLSAVTIAPDREHLGKALDQKEWRTVERLGLARVSLGAKVVGQLLSRMPGVKTVCFFNGPFASELEGLGGPFPTVKLIATSDWIPLARVPAFPGLEAVCTYAKDPRVALQAARRGGLRTLMLRSSRDVSAALEAFDRSRTVEELRLAPGMTSDLVPRGWLVRVTHAERSTAELAHAGRFVASDFLPLVNLLAAHGRTELRVRCPPSLSPKLTKEAPDATITFDHRPFDVFGTPP